MSFLLGWVDTAKLALYFHLIDIGFELGRTELAPTLLLLVVVAPGGVILSRACELALVLLAQGGTGGLEPPILLAKSGTDALELLAGGNSSIVLLLVGGWS